MSNERLNSRITNFLLWMRNNKDQLIIIAAIFLFLLFLVPLSLDYKAKQFDKQIDQYVKIQSFYYSNKFLESIEQIDAFLPTVSKKSSMNKLLLFYKGNSFYSLAKFAEAITIYEDLLKKYSNDYLAVNFVDGISYSYEGLGNYEMAIKSWQRIINDFSDSYLVPNAYKSIARNYELLLDFPKAKETYQLIINMFPETLWADFAKTRLEFFKNNI